MLKKISNYKKIFILNEKNIFFYIENNNIIIGSYLGMSKLKLSKSLSLDKISNNIIFKIKYLDFLYRPRYNYNFTQYYINNIFSIIKNLTIGHTIKYKIIGLGHKVLYSKNNYLLKLGYSHLIYCFIPIIFSAKKKKKKKQFNKITSLEYVKLNNFFYFINKLRVPDIFSMNGIFNRTCYLEFKAGKKSFLM